MSYTAFIDGVCQATGDIRLLVQSLRNGRAEAESGRLLIFDDTRGAQIDLDLSGSIEEAVSRAEEMLAPAPNKVGRPKLGVVAREVTLLPRHWEWLEGQPSGASAALRRLVDDARKGDSSRAEFRAAADAACRVLSALAGNLEGYEDATRALYARDRQGFESHISEWPTDIRAYAVRMAGPALE
jgi:hypothetical protein